MIENLMCRTNLMREGQFVIDNLMCERETVEIVN